MDRGEFSVEGVTKEWLLGRQAMKWRRYPPDVIPLWVADMDFPVAACVKEVVARLTAAGDFGYAMRDGEWPGTALARAFSRHMDAKYGWQPDPDNGIAVSDLVQAMFAATIAFSDPGRGIVLQTPSYPPFRDAIVSNGRRLEDCPLTDTGQGHVIDFDRLAEAASGDTQMMFLCNPHNPTGRVFTRGELERIADIACANDLVVVADEIHSDFVYDGNRHIPLASISAEIAARTVTLTSATKSYGTAGLKCGIAHFGSAELKQRFHTRIHPRVLGSVGSTGIDTTIAAWTDGAAWLQEATDYLRGNRDFLVETLRRELPEARMHRPEATYLAWIDFSACNLPGDPFSFFLEKARVALSEGATFDPRSATFGRLNFATTRPILVEALERMVAAVRAHHAG